MCGLLGLSCCGKSLGSMYEALLGLEDFVCLTICLDVTGTFFSKDFKYAACCASICMKDILFDLVATVFFVIFSLKVGGDSDDTTFDEGLDPPFVLFMLALAVLTWGRPDDLVMKEEGTPPSF